MQWWQVLLVFCGGPLLLFALIWALVWLTTKPSAVPAGVAQPSHAPSGGFPLPQDADTTAPTATDPRPVHQPEKAEEQE